MLKMLRKILKVGLITEPYLPNKDFHLEKIGDACKKIIDAKFKGSLAIRHVDAGSCNGCELEIHALNNSFYNIERFNIHFVASPRHADLLLVTGPVSRNMESALITTVFEGEENRESQRASVHQWGATAGVHPKRRGSIAYRFY